MNIPQEAIDKASVSIWRISPHAPTADRLAIEALTAALPHLIADLQDRLAVDVVKLTVLAEDPKVLPERRAHLLSKASGVTLSLSKLDEMTR